MGDFIMSLLGAAAGTALLAAFLAAFLCVVIIDTAKALYCISKQPA